MPEGHSIHRLAQAFRRTLVGQVLHVSSPQGRFRDGAALLDGKRLVCAAAYGKHLFLGFSSPNVSYEDADTVSSSSDSMLNQFFCSDSGSVPQVSVVWLHIHLGIYGSWRFSGDETFNAPHIIGAPRKDVLPAVSSVVFGQDGDTRRKSTRVEGLGAETDFVEIPVHTQVDTSELIAHEHFADRWFLDGADKFVAPKPVGAVRLRLLGEHGVADLSGPNTCELLDAAGVQGVLGRLGPDPLRPDSQVEDFLKRCSTRKKSIGEALMDQSVLAGVGNIYRAEVLFAVKLNPQVSACQLNRETLCCLWDWLVEQMPVGVQTGRVTTMNPDDYAVFAQSHPLEVSQDPVAVRYYVYQREGKPCVRCSQTVNLKVVAGRKLYWCPNCQS